MEATGFGVMHVDAKDTHHRLRREARRPAGIPGQPDMALASMGIYVFGTKFLADLLRRDADDPELQPRLRQGHHPLRRRARQGGGPPLRRLLRALDRRGRVAYWRDVGTVDAYWEANIDLTDIIPELDLYDTTWPIWTYAELTPPAKFVHDEDGRRGSAVLAGRRRLHHLRRPVRRSLVSTGVPRPLLCRPRRGGAAARRRHRPQARLRRVVIDRGVRIPEGLVVGEDPELDAQRFRRTEAGICLITQPMIDQLDAT